MKSGIDQAGVDHDVRPQDDLFGYVNGRWLATTQIPEDRGRYGTFDVLRETAEEHVRAIIEEVAAGAPEAGTVAAKVGDLYASFMDEGAVEALGVAPLADDLAQVAAVTDAGDVVALSGVFGRCGVLGSSSRSSTPTTATPSVTWSTSSRPAWGCPTSRTTARTRTPTSAPPTSHTSSGCSRSSAGPTPKVLPGGSWTWRPGSPRGTGTR